MSSTTGSSPRFVPADEIEAFGYARAVDAIEAALRGGLDPSADPARSITVVDQHARILSMPSVGTDAAGVKLVTTNPANPAAGAPYVHGVYVLFERPTLAPTAILDGAALTTVRTPAVSVAAVRSALRTFDRPLRLVVFGAGPQGIGHLDALTAVALRDGDFPAPGEVTLVARRKPADRLLRRPGVDLSALAIDDAAVARAVATADVVVCATPSGAPLFDSALLPDHTVVIAVGSHTPEAIELDPGFCARADVIVEDRATALRECGEIVQADRAGLVSHEDLRPIAEVVRGTTLLAGDRPVLFKGGGMAWEDLVVARAVSGLLTPGSRGA